jgi:homogentisate 1,2-dioxygenase
VHLYDATTSMADRYFVNADGELLIVPQSGRLLIHTECGLMETSPGEIALIPCGMKFKVDLVAERARGFICENYGAQLRLPERGPVGSDGFANTRDFLTPAAHYEADEKVSELICKFQGALYAAELPASPLDVVAWVGNAVPYKYDLRRFNTINTVSFDHPDPSIFTVLTAPSATAGVANIDFVVIPARWLVAEHTFRPPWYHRNVMSEFLGLIYGEYDAKKKGFAPGGMSLHNSMVPHGPEAAVHAAASVAPLTPVKLDNTMAFMFESRYVFHVTRWALESPAFQADYRACWDGLTPHFKTTI